MSPLKQFGLKVRQLRESKGWSQEQLAEAADLHRTYVSGIERGARNPTLTVICRVAKGFGISPSELLGKVQAK